MFRFTIRDVLWLMVVVAVALAMWGAWSRDHARLRKAVTDIRGENISTQTDLAGVVEELARLDAESRTKLPTKIP